MTRKDYVMLARVIQRVDGYFENRPQAEYEAVEPCHVTAELVGALADELAHDNDRFDRELFYRACGHG